MMIPISDFSRSNLYGLGDLTKISLYYFGTFANFTIPIVNFSKLWFFAQNLSKLKFIRLTPPNSITY